MNRESPSNTRKQSTYAMSSGIPQDIRTVGMDGEQMGVSTGGSLIAPCFIPGYVPTTFAAL